VLSREEDKLSISIIEKILYEMHTGHDNHEVGIFDNPEVGFIEDFNKLAVHADFNFFIANEGINKNTNLNNRSYEFMKLIWRELDRNIKLGKLRTEAKEEYNKFKQNTKTTIEDLNCKKDDIDDSF
jgi:hypothetical protein